MSGITAILRRSCRPACSQNLMETYVGPCVSSGASLRLFISSTKHLIKPCTSILNQIKPVGRYSPVNGSLGVLSIRRAYPSDTGVKPEVSQNTISNVPSTEIPEIGTASAGGNTWIDILHNARKSTIDATTDAGKKVKELTDAITPHVQQLFDANPNLEKVVVPLGGTLFGTMMPWFVMPIILRRLHKYASQGPIAALLGNSTKNDVSYQTSLWNALEDPAKYLYHIYGIFRDGCSYCTNHISLSSTGMEGCICSLFCLVPS